MSWFYQLPLSVICSIIFPLIVILFYCIIKKRKEILAAPTGKSFMATTALLTTIALWTIFLKAIETYNILVDFKPIGFTILWILLSGMVAALIWGGIITYKVNPYKRKQIITIFILGGICIAIFLFINFFIV